jgi:hypothetical protein
MSLTGAHGFTIPTDALWGCIRDITKRAYSPNNITHGLKKTSLSRMDEYHYYIGNIINNDITGKHHFTQYQDYN